MRKVFAAIRKVFAAIGLCALCAAVLSFVANLVNLVIVPMQSRPILVPYAQANTKANAQRLQDEPVASGKFIIDFMGDENAPIYQLGKTTVGELEDGTGLRYGELEWDDATESYDRVTERICLPGIEETIILCNSGGSTDVWGFDVHLVIANRTGKETSYRNCTIVAISNVDNIMVPGGAYTGIAWDRLRWIYGGAFTEENHFILDGTGNEKFSHVNGEDGQGRISFTSFGHDDDVDYIGYDVRPQKTNDEEKDS